MADLLEPATVAAPPKRRRRWPWPVGAGIVGVAVFVVVWFQPQKLFLDERVDEPSPVDADDRIASTSPGAPRTLPSSPSEPVDIAGGSFVSIDHGTNGRVRILELTGGQRIVRLEGLDTSNGPDLYLYLSANPASGEESAFDDDYVNLGRLKGNLGDQNYDLPSGTDLARYRTLVIWCDRFNSAFGAADLAATLDEEHLDGDDD